jgi:hypothetical protein
LAFLPRSRFPRGESSAATRSQKAGTIPFPAIILKNDLKTTINNPPFRRLLKTNRAPTKDARFLFPFTF